MYGLGAIGLSIWLCKGNSDTGRPLTYIVALLVVIAWLILDFPYLFQIWVRHQRRIAPMAIHVAYELPRFPRFLRPLVFLWWLTHFAMAVVAAYAIHLAVPGNGGGTLSHRVSQWILAVIVAAGLCATANGFLIAAIASLTPRREIAEKVWGARHLIDFGVAIAVCLIPVAK